MNIDHILESLFRIREQFAGDILADELDRMVYSTDASVYQENPAAVVCPANEQDVQLAVELARKVGVGVIPRAAGTSLAGQVVGSGIVVDISRHMTKVLEVNADERWVRVQPGIIRDELNLHLAQHGLFFGPETSTSNRATIGGMLGNNSCGSNSIVYGTTRDQTLEVTGVMADGSIATFCDQSDSPDHSNMGLQNRFQTEVIRQTLQLLGQPNVAENIAKDFPGPDVARRNTGYALDKLLDCQQLGGSGPLNFCRLIAGSEGTLFLATEIRLRCHPILQTTTGLFVPHFDSVEQALRATQVVMKHCSGEPTDERPNVFACELIDRFILEGAARNIDQKRNLEFVRGTPQAVLIVDLRAKDRGQIESLADQIRSELKKESLGYEFPLVFDEWVGRVWSLRKAGLGVVANVKGDEKPVTLIEDTAVALDVLPDFIAAVRGLLSEKYDSACVYYGHAGAGELHLRPLVNLKSSQGVERFRAIAEDVADIVKRFGGSLSGEHGDGRLRGEFVRRMVGEFNYSLIEQIKEIWDPQNVMNPGKIVNAQPMDSGLRFQVGTDTRDLETVFDFDETLGLQRAAEMCSGSGDCRKTELTGGVMCPSYMVTRDEKHSTRARANVLRQVISNRNVEEPLADERVKEVMDLCLSCKGCKSECPSNVDVAKMKAEFQHHYYKENGVPRRARVIAGFARMARRTRRLAGLGNWAGSSRLMGGWLKRRMGIHPARSLPRLNRQTLKMWFNKHVPDKNAGTKGKVLLFCDEFTNYSDVEVGIAAVELLERLGFAVEIPSHQESGRASISQGLLGMAKGYAESNVRELSTYWETGKSQELWLVGIEPSALLTLRDEYPVLVSEELRAAARQLASRSLLIDEFISQLLEQGTVDATSFTNESRMIRLHGHCHQKALSSMKDTIRMLQLPPNYRVAMIPAGCCGMAGAFGYEEEHYEISMQIGELVLFPAIRSESPETLIAAGGTSCRHQILDGTGRKAWHPVQILRDSLI